MSREKVFKTMDGNEAAAHIAYACRPYSMQHPELLLLTAIPFSPVMTMLWLCAVRVSV